MSELNIYQKLVEVRKACKYLKKDNKGYQFSYVSSSQTLGSLRAAMDEHNLLLVPSVTSHETRDHTTKKGDHEYFTIATMSFTWVNADKPEERETCQWYGQGIDNGEKGVGKAVTYAEKYFLLKFFNIATDKDDPDSFQKKAAAKNEKKVAAAAPHLAQGNIDGWVAIGIEHIMKGPPSESEESKTAWWKKVRQNVIDDCGSEGAKEVHKKVVA